MIFFLRCCAGHGSQLMIALKSRLIPTFLLEFVESGFFERRIIKSEKEIHPMR